MSPAQSPLASSAPVSEPIIEITPTAHAELIKLRDAEEDAASLGLRLEIVSGPGEEFKYDLSLDEFRKAAFSDEVRTHDGLKVIVPAKDVDHIDGNTNNNDASNLRPLCRVCHSTRTARDQSFGRSL